MKRVLTPRRYHNATAGMGKHGDGGYAVPGKSRARKPRQRSCGVVVWLVLVMPCFHKIQSVGEIDHSHRANTTNLAQICRNRWHRGADEVLSPQLDLNSDAGVGGPLRMFCGVGAPWLSISAARLRAILSLSSRAAGCQRGFPGLCFPCLPCHLPSLPRATT